MIDRNIKPSEVLEARGQEFYVYVCPFCGHKIYDVINHARSRSAYCAGCMNVVYLNVGDKDNG